MSKNLNFVGLYTIKGAKFYNKDNTFIVSERKKATTKKANKFLLRLNPLTGKRDYISSIYTTKDSTQFNFDYNNEKYLISMNSLNAQITIR